MKVPIDLTQKEQAAAKRLLRLEEWFSDGAGIGSYPYRRLCFSPSNDERTVAAAVVRAMAMQKKGKR